MSASIEEALRNERVQSLYDEVNALTPISLTFEPAGNWGSITRNGLTEITATPTKTPAAALAHELLHAKFKIAGYRQYVMICSMDEDQDPLKPIGEALDNELQHHRMFGDFIALGLNPAEFYHDHDHQAFPSVRKTLRKMRITDHPGWFLLQYLTIIAPGGAGTDEERRKLKSFFKTQCSKETWQSIQTIETEFEKWKSADTIDPGRTIANIFRLLGRFSRTWVGISQDGFPDDGYFSGDAFTATELIDWHQAQTRA